MGIDTQHDIVMVRTSMIVNLVLLFNCPLFKFCLDGAEHIGNGVLTETGDQSAIPVLLQIGHGKVMTVLIQS